MFVPDLLHEFELGVWKAIFTHLIRILYAAGSSGIQSLNWRYVHQDYKNCSILMLLIDTDRFAHMVAVQFDYSMRMRQL